MPDFLKTTFANGPEVSPANISIRLALALALGWVVAFIYTRTRSKTEISPTFPTTLVLLSVLIAMVTQVIGDNVARAFSLVGALSIVRFRTVVRDTQDTAYVIFAVVVGMAVGAQNPWVAFIGLGIIGVASFAMAWRPGGVPGAKLGYLLSVRVEAGKDLEKLAGGILGQQLQSRELMSVSTAKQGASLEYIYQVYMRGAGVPEELVKTLNQLEGVQSVELQQRGFEID
jgi:hypothetical protein